MSAHRRTRRSSSGALRTRPAGGSPFVAPPKRRKPTKALRGAQLDARLAYQLEHLRVATTTGDQPAVTRLQRAIDRTFAAMAQETSTSPTT